MAGKLLIALLVSCLLVAACTQAAPETSPMPSVTQAASPPASQASPRLERNRAQEVTPEEAASQIRKVAVGIRPVLLPTDLPPGTRAQVDAAGENSFAVTYTSGSKLVRLAIIIPNPPPLGPTGSQAHPSFHGDQHSLYEVMDTTQPVSRRMLMWDEPGKATVPLKPCECVPYFLVTEGLTETEFWHLHQLAPMVVRSCVPPAARLRPRTSPPGRGGSST